MQFMPKIDRFSHDLIAPHIVSDPVGWIVADGVIEGLHGTITPAISVRMIREAALKYPQIGLVDLKVQEDTMAMLQRADAALAEANARIEELEATAERFAGLAREGYKVVKVQGRPKNKVGA